MSSTGELRSAGLKATLPRLKVLEAFERSELRHLTAEDLYKLLLDMNEDIGLATVYRVLTQFERAGLVSRSSFEGGKATFELDGGEHHDHLVCLQCGKVEEFLDPSIEERQRKIAKAHGFELSAHVLSLYGNCLRTDCPNRR